MTPPPPITDPGVAAVFQAYPEPLRERLLALRTLVYEAAPSPLTESLKWGQPAWRRTDGRGTTVRLDALKGVDGGHALYVHCQTSLVDTFRGLYGDQLRFEGDRAILLSLDQPAPREALAHCIGLALSYRT
ncbi:DUF1801 domain-containing protein [Caulobacter mirabilis]|uniref:YdhG-like domain-containing protein n=1 Tax=Caulobacter mirabilis TaxID=69666 RepID=A0A2D2AYY1_9CAUL|nr:DUF1801 domain-containing protein [Caulobacter mirabilis]ATQ43220.1 hypothetical protein CSW64_12740 [Caulobacter mirabilis]